jgi:hypothetical protein
LDGFPPPPLFPHPQKWRREGWGPWPLANPPKSIHLSRGKDCDGLGLCWECAKSGRGAFGFKFCIMLLRMGAVTILGVNALQSKGSLYFLLVHQTCT